MSTWLYLPIAPVNITVNPAPADRVMVGDIVQFTCAARSIPPSNISWFRTFEDETFMIADEDSVQITTNFVTSSTLSVNVSEDEDFALYFCVAYNTFDNETSNSAQLSSIVAITQQPEPVGPLAVEQTATFTCIGRSIPQPTRAVWLRGSETVEKGNTTTITSDTMGFNLTTMLNVTVSGDEDFALYSCIIFRDSDNANATSSEVPLASFVSFTEQPQSSVPSSVGDIVPFVCEARSFPAPTTITWFRIEDGSEVELVNGSDITIMLGPGVDDLSLRSGLTVTVTGYVDFALYFCRAESDFDNATSDPAQLPSVVNITRQPESPAPLLVGEEANLTCEARSVPRPNITWFRLEGEDQVLVDNLSNVRIILEAVMDEFSTRSLLSVMVEGDADFTSYFCVAESGFDNTTSEVVQLVQAGEERGSTLPPSLSILCLFFVSFLSYLGYSSTTCI